jgi:hypothetical protein
LWCGAWELLGVLRIKRLDALSMKAEIMTVEVL